MHFTRVNCDACQVDAGGNSITSIKPSNNPQMFLLLLLLLLLLQHLNMVPPRIVNPVVWMKAVVFIRSSMLLHSCSCGVAPWGHCCVLTFPKRGQNCRTRSGDCGPLWYGQFSLCASPRWHNRLRLLSCRCSSQFSYLRTGEK